MLVNFTVLARLNEIKIGQGMITGYVVEFQTLTSVRRRRDPFVMGAWLNEWSKLVRFHDGKKNVARDRNHPTSGVTVELRAKSFDPSQLKLVKTSRN